MSALASIRTRFTDTLTNLITGMGIEGRAKNASNTFGLRILTPLELESAYRSDWVARKIIKIPPADMTREWREWKADDADIELLENLENSLKIRSHVRNAMIRDRLYGGGLILMGGLPGNWADEVKPESVPKGGLKYLVTLNRYQVTTPVLDRDPTSEFFGEPAYYLVNSPKTGEVRIHPSRTVRFVSDPVPDGLSPSIDGWGDPLLQSVYDAVMNVASSQQNIADLLAEAKIDVVSIPGLMSAVSSQTEKDNLLTRFALAGLAKGQNNVLLLDKEEVWEQKQVSFAQLPDVAQMFLQVAAASADIPVTRMLGQSPKGLSATGDMDLQNYYDGLSGVQNNDLKPRIDRLDQILIRSALGASPADLWWEFGPLWQMSDKDKAGVALQKAQATQIYMTSGLVPTDALAQGVQAQLVEDGTYPGLEQFLEESTMEIEALAPTDPAQNPALDPNLPKNRTANQQPATKASKPTQMRRAANDAAPRTLYVSRKVLNGDELLRWARSQGFKSTLPAAELHVTVAFSRTAIDWMAVGNAYGDKDGDLLVPPGGPRLVEPLGDKGAIVLLFSSWELCWRHGDILRAGASWDYDGFQPHITITYDGADVDVSKVEPYQGKIELGPEIFAEVVEDWEKGVAEIVSETDA